MPQRDVLSQDAHGDHDEHHHVQALSAIRQTDQPNTRPFLEVRGLSKRFGGVQALNDVSVDFYAGEVHGLVGANGAGKSTLIRCLAGVVTPDAGEIILDGNQVVIRDVQQASHLGLGFIHQELNLVPKFSALQNLMLGLPKQTRLGLIDWRFAAREVAPVVARLGIQFSLTTPVEKLSVAEQWMISIGRALIHNARLIAMDEPTASLSAEESARLFKVIRDLSTDGIAILYVSHRLHEITLLCDRVTVFKDGERVTELARDALSKEALVGAIVGGEARTLAPSPKHLIAGRTILEVRGLQRGHVVRDVSLAVHEGEILGLGGLVGAGRTETARLIFGADPPDAGEMLLDGQPVQPRRPADAVKRGIGLVPEERRSQGLILDKSVNFNLNASSFPATRIFRWLPLINRRHATERAMRISSELRVKTSSMEAAVSHLSGGNQQKVVIGKWLVRGSRLLILDEPTRGVDVGARAEIYRVIRELAATGAAILLISSESEELVSLCDRVLVMVEGRISGELVGEKITEDAILNLSYAHEHGMEQER